MAKPKATLDIIAEIGAVKMPPAPCKGISVVFSFAADEDILPRLVHARKNHLVRLYDIDRGNGKLKNFGIIDGQIKSISLPTKVDRPGQFVVLFDETKGLYEALRYIRQCDPSSCAIIETQIEIPDPSESNAEDDDDQIELPEEQ